MPSNVSSHQHPRLELRPINPHIGVELGGVETGIAELRRERAARIRDRAATHASSAASNSA